jgi:hypothetical protein
MTILSNELANEWKGSIELEPNDCIALFHRIISRDEEPLFRSGGFWRPRLSGSFEDMASRAPWERTTVFCTNSAGRLGEDDDARLLLSVGNGGERDTRWFSSLLELLSLELDVFSRRCCCSWVHFPMWLRIAVRACFLSAFV